MKYWILLACLLLTLEGRSQQQPQTIRLSVMPGLQFDLVRFRVAPGTPVRIILSNTDDMNHNILITQPGAREQVVNEAAAMGAEGPAADYIPTSPRVLWSMKVVAPEQEDTLLFNAPATEGVYPYVCTYPGHGFVMYGAMYVQRDTALPDIAKDMNIPPARRKAGSHIALEEDETHHHHHQPSKTLHPYTPVPPYHYRVFIEGASPAAIAVSLPDSVSYCWDAGDCRLRFAWTGGFLDNSDLWKGKGDALAKVTGHIFFRQDDRFPLQPAGAKSAPAAQYKGYRLINRYPEFHYTINGLHVYELIRPAAGGKGLERQFRIPGATGGLTFWSVPSDHVRYTSSAGEWNGAELRLNAAQAKAFTITMTAL
ncbi:plastocyanin/azurin family copper-binding protein [Chitinophaga lutea]